MVQGHVRIVEPVGHFYGQRDVIIDPLLVFGDPEESDVGSERNLAGIVAVELFRIEGPKALGADVVNGELHKF